MLISTGGLDRDQGVWESRRLWSLWDMLEFNASAFSVVTERLTSTSAWVAASKDKEGGVFNPARRLDDTDVKYLKARFDDLPEMFETLGARLSAISAREAQGYFTRSWADWGGVREKLDDIKGRLKDELSLMSCFALEPKHQGYFTSAEPLFGADFATKFVSAAFDLDEAAKSLALGRPTACVFHLMRVMELGVHAVARCLQIPDPVKPAQRNWGIVLGKVDEGIKAKWPNAIDRASGDGALFESLYASLDAVKNPWRNDTMHPGAKYTDEEAEHVFIAVKGFMKKLASRLDEKGMPLA
jgi:hypothetical protein